MDMPKQKIELYTEDLARIRIEIDARISKVFYPLRRRMASAKYATWTVGYKRMMVPKSGPGREWSPSNANVTGLAPEGD